MPDRVALVTALILDRPMCEDCILDKSGLTDIQLQTTLNGVRQIIRLHVEGDRCRNCGEWKRVLRLSPR